MYRLLQIHRFVRASQGGSISGRWCLLAAVPLLVGGAYVAWFSPASPRHSGSGDYALLELYAWHAGGGP